LDVAATAENAKCSRFFTRKENGLAQPWQGRVFCNPPYGREIGRWVQKAWQSAQAGACELVVCLVPARVDTAWWHDYGALVKCDSCAAACASAEQIPTRRFLLLWLCFVTLLPVTKREQKRHLEEQHL
jgi:DNA N-6-adenine-methyltransferase (Dam)